MEDGSRSGVNVMPAIVTGIRRAAFHAMVLRNLFAVLAKDSFRVQVVPEPFQTGSIVGKLALEVFQRERRHFWLAIHTLTYCQVKAYA
jgi:hypothetical protein